jgi:hypothetical protein
MDLFVQYKEVDSNSKCTIETNRKKRDALLFYGDVQKYVNKNSGARLKA